MSVREYLPDQMIRVNPVAAEETSMSLSQSPYKKAAALLLGPLLMVGASAYYESFSDPVRSEAEDALKLPARARLGRLLYNDKNLSEPAGQSCASCHDVSAGFTDPNRADPTSRGVHTQLSGNRNAPTAAYAAFSPAFHFDEAEQLFIGGQFFDGRATSLEEQAKGPFLNPVEMGNSNKEQVVDKVRRSAYADQFRREYGARSLDDSEQAYELIAQAIATFERSPIFNRFTSKYDAYLEGRTRLNAAEMRGLSLFERSDKGNCAACHPSAKAEDGSPPLFTDFSYDNLGVPKNPLNRFYSMPAQFNPQGRNFVDKGLGAQVNLASEDGKFKVPTLRNIALTGPYMHNGYFQTLRGAVDFYNSRDVKPACKDTLVKESAALKKGCWPKAEVGDNVNHDELGNLHLSAREVDDIVTFLHTLTDGWQGAQEQAHAHAR
jgi:cytochrome c peroxidase